MGNGKRQWESDSSPLLPFDPGAYLLAGSSHLLAFRSRCLRCSPRRVVFGGLHDYPDLTQFRVTHADVSGYSAASLILFFALVRFSWSN